MSPVTTISTHVLDTAFGTPAENVAVTLERIEVGTATAVARGVTNADGRVPSFASGDAMLAGDYRLCFDVAAYFADTQRKSFYAEICIAFTVDDQAQHYHVPLLLSPFGYSTYRGS